MPSTAETAHQMSAEVTEQPSLMLTLVPLAVFGCIALAASLQIADVVVPDHNWIADTISDLTAGRHELIVDTGLYVFFAALTGLAVPTTHSHLGACDWSVGVIALLGCGLLVFLTIAIGSLLAGCVQATDWSGLAQALIEISALLGIQYVVSRTRARRDDFEGLIDNMPTLLMRDGELQEAAVTRTRTSPQ